MNSLKEIDELKTKILKYILYKKRTEKEIRQKFSDISVELLEDTIEHLKDVGYINDNDYIKRAIKEFIALKTLSIREVSYKLQAKGISKSDIENYVLEHKEELLRYEVQSAVKLIQKKQMIMEKDQIKNYLRNKGYMEETIDLAYDELL